MRQFIIAAIFLIASLTSAHALEPREGWVVIPTDKPFDVLVKDTTKAVKANKMGVVTQAGPTRAAASRGITIPGNRVIGVFNNRFAVRILGLSEAAMIEAPIRLYVTEQPDGTATLSYKTPSFIYTPYIAEAGPELSEAASELDTIFRAIAEAAVQ
jgi:uncharacterized protein (DUF302 family)